MIRGSRRRCSCSDRATGASSWSATRDWDTPRRPAFRARDGARPKHEPDGRGPLVEAVAPRRVEGGGPQVRADDGLVGWKYLEPAEWDEPGLLRSACDRRARRGDRWRDGGPDRRDPRADASGDGLAGDHRRRPDRATRVGLGARVRRRLADRRGRTAGDLRTGGGARDGLRGRGSDRACDARNGETCRRT